ncbi:MAG: YmdB family metallophosphoesterase [Clostridia bacterium]|nr:YmdB family metallophosphoesterase [Clostridia bacterium]
MKQANILVFADVCGERALVALCRQLPALRREYKADLVIVNAENASNEGNCHPALCEALFDAGADVLTGGNHTLKQAEMHVYLDNHPRALRCENLSAPAAGMGHVVVETAGFRILVTSMLGQAFLSGADNPFTACDRLLEAQKGKYDFAVCDFHGEATAEKSAFAHDFDGKFAVVFGTHTHVPTADLQILEGGTAFITDLGMCGAKDSVLGVDTAASIRRFRQGPPLDYIPATGKTVLMGALFTVGENGKTISAERIEKLV